MSWGVHLKEGKSLSHYITQESKQLTVESHSAGIVSTLHQTTITAILILLNWISTLLIKVCY
jgi:hypothetical protein